MVIILTFYANMQSTIELPCLRYPAGRACSRPTYIEQKTQIAAFETKHCYHAFNAIPEFIIIIIVIDNI
jgi:hypothetical protein